LVKIEFHFPLDVLCQEKDLEGTTLRDTLVYCCDGGIHELLDFMPEDKWNDWETCVEVDWAKPLPTSTDQSSEPRS